MKILYIVILLFIICIIYQLYDHYKQTCFRKYYCIGNIPDNQAKIYKLFDYISSNIPDECDLFIPSQFDDADSEIKKFMKSIKIINGILNMDYICSKANLYLFLSSVYPNEVLDTLIPKTHLSKDIKNAIDLNCEHQAKVFILKKDIQQQKGLYISNNTREIVGLSEDPDIVVMQEFLTNPFIISDVTNGEVVHRKINLRIYILVTVNKGILRVFVYTDGFVYYTPEGFEYMSLNSKRMITSGYIDRGVYERNPLTLKDLERNVNKRNYNYSAFWEALKRKLVLIFVPFAIAWKAQNAENLHYQIFGADVEPNANFEDMKFLEFNKGPDLSSKSTRDIDLKDSMLRDSLKIVLENDLASTSFEEL